MTTLPRRAGTALVVIDVQNGVVADTYNRDAVVSNIASLVQRAGDSFEGTDLGEILQQRGIGKLVVAGARTDACIRSTIHGAFARGYDVTLVGDAHTTGDLTQYGAPPPQQVISHTNLYWQFQSAPGRRGLVVTAKQVEFAAGEA